MSQSFWFHDEKTLLNELRVRDVHDQTPEMPGYGQVVPIKRGGQGMVYRAVQQGTNRVVAIKVMFEDVANFANCRLRFEREVELAGLLEHPNIVRLYDGGVLRGGRLFTVMSFVDGVSLDEYVEGHGLEKNAIVRLFTEVCDAISYAHRRGVIHRDLKPSNILVTQDGLPQVLDFGVARAVGQTHQSTKTGEFLGTLAYASPEQIAGNPAAIDTRTDVYSLGVVLYRLLTGQFPYPVEGSIADVVQAIQTCQPATASDLSQTSDKELDAIIGRALEKRPDDRYTSVHALMNDLQRYLEGEPIEAKRHSKWYVFRKTVKHNRWKVAAALGLLAILLSFAVIVTGLWQRAVAEELRSKKINVFWEDTLGSVTPSQPDKPIAFREVLDEAVQWVAITTENRPEEEASLRTTIGNGYRNLGLFQEAEQQLNCALDIRRRLYGNKHIDVIQSLNSIALLRKTQGRLQEAEMGFHATLQARQQLLGKNHPDVAMSWQNLGRVAMEDGRLDEADDCFAKALEIRRRHFDSDDPAIATVYFNQGDVAMIRQDWQSAQQLYLKALNIQRARLATTHPDLARSLLALSRAHLASGSTGEATRLAEQALRVRLATLDPQHMLVQEVNRLIEEIGQYPLPNSNERPFFR